MGFTAAAFVMAGAALAEDGKPAPESDGIHVLVRKNFADLWLFDDPTAPSMAEGAAFSYVHDGVADDDTWAVQGMIAVPLTFGGDSYGPIVGASVAPYIQLDRQNHTGDGVDINVITGGLSGEIGFQFAGRRQFLPYPRRRDPG